MDSGPGRCWVCDAPGKLWCSGCRFALYCSLACQKKDKVRHLDECFNSSRRRVHCSYCGRDETLGGVACPECLVCSYCTDSCRKIDAKNHKPVCQKAKEKVLEAAKKIGDWNRRAKGIPQYLGRLIHAVDYLRWRDNEGSKVPTTSSEATNARKIEEERQKESRRTRKSTPNEAHPTKEGEAPLRLLLLGADLKHVLRTLHDTPDTCTQGIEITLMDSSPHILARDLLVLYLLMLPDAPTPLQDQAMLTAHAEKVVMVFYSLCLDMETHALLCNTLHNLLNMTYKSFLHEMRQQVYIDAVSFTLVQAVWNGWMSFANDPSTMQKMEKVRTLKMSGKVVKDVLSRFVKSCPKEHQKAVTDWIKRGSMKKQKGCHFPNVTLACFSPLKKEYLDRFEDVSPKWSEETEWIKAVSPEEDMIYAPHGIDMVFQDWDFVLVSKNTRKESNVVEMYMKFLTQVFKRCSQKLLKSNQVSVKFIRATIKDVRRSPTLLRGKFDRIATGIHADLLGTPFVLQELGAYLSTDNAHARLVTHHRVWSLCLNWQLDQQAREMYQKCIKNNKPADLVTMISSRWSTFRHFLQAELLHHLHILDGRPVELQNVLPFRDVSHAYDMILSDYTHHLNHVVPFRFRPEKRMVSMVDSRLHSLEWRRIGRSRKSTAPAPAQPKTLPNTQSSEVDPASRYVDNLISLSRNSPVPPPVTVNESCPNSRLCSREGSLSPCPSDYLVTTDERRSRPRQANRTRPRSLYVSTRCKSPLLSSEFDFWEQQNLITEQKGTSKSIQCTEIPQGIKNRAQMSLEAELKQAKLKAKSAPASPLAKCKPRMVKEKATAFERGSSVRSTYPDTRKHMDAITPTTPVKKLVMMFSKAFTTKEKESELMKPLKRSNSFHGRRASFEQADRPEIMPTDYNKAKNAVESGVCTLPRKSRPHSIAVSKYSYLEGCIDKRIEAFHSTSKDGQEKEKKKKEVKKPTSLDLVEGPRSRKKQSSPIRSLIAGLNTLSVSPVMPRAAKQHKKTLKDTISIKRDELRLVKLRPGSPVASSPTFEGIEAIDWPESHVSPRTPTDSPRKTPSDISKKASMDHQKKTQTDSPRRSPDGSPVLVRAVPLRRTPSPTPSSSSLPRMFNSLKRSLKKIPLEPEYVAPPLCVSKSPAITLHSPTADKYKRCSFPLDPPTIDKKYNRRSYPLDLQSDQHLSPTYHSEGKCGRLEDIFSPKPSPTHSHENLHTLQKQEAAMMMKGQNSGLRVQTIKPDIENAAVHKEQCVVQTEPFQVKETDVQKDIGSQKEEEVGLRESELPLSSGENLSPEALMAMTSDSMAVSLKEADQEVSELFSHEETFTPIKPKRSNVSDDDILANHEDEDSASSEIEFVIHKEEKKNETSVSGPENVMNSTKPLLEKQHTNSPVSPVSVDSPAPENVMNLTKPLLEIQHTNSPVSVDSPSPENVMNLTKPLLEIQHTNSPASPVSVDSPSPENVMNLTNPLLEIQHTNSPVSPVSVDSPNPEIIQSQTDTQNSSKSASPQIIEQCPPPVYKIVERFAQRIQAEQQCIERPASPKGYNVMKKNSCSEETSESSSPQEKEVAANATELQTKQESEPVQDTKSPSTKNETSVPKAKDSFPKAIDDTTLQKSKGNVTKRVKKAECLPEMKTKSIKDELREIIKVNKSESECLSVSKFPATSSPKPSLGLHTTPVKGLSPTPVNKMVEKFALQIHAQSLPPSPRATRPQSIGTLIQQDFLRLYSENQPTDEIRLEEDVQENLSLVSDCCEETMFEITDDEEQQTGDIGIDTDEKSLPKSKVKPKASDTGIVDNKETPSKVLDAKEHEKVDDTASSESQSKDTTLKKHIPSNEKENTPASNVIESPTPRESKCDELRHEFLQKIRGIGESPIPPCQKKYGEIKATLNKRKNDILQGEKMFSDDGQNSRALTSSPRLEDMSIVNYTIKLDATESLTERLRTPPITPWEDQGGAIGLLAEKEKHGLDEDSFELCSTELKKASEAMGRSNARNSPQAQHSPKFNTLPRKAKSRSISSPTTSLKGAGRKKLPEIDISQHKVKMLKSSRTGGMDKMSFRHFVKASIQNEDLQVPESETAMASDSQVIEYTSSVEVSTEEFESNPEDVEEAVEAISLTSEDDDEPPRIRKKKFTAKNGENPDLDPGRHGLKCESPRNAGVRRKRLPSSRSPSDLKHQDDAKPYCSSPRTALIHDTDDSDLGEDTTEKTRRPRASKRSDKSIDSPRHSENLLFCPQTYSDDARQSPDSVDLNFKVDIPDTPIDSNRDIRRFMWGSLKRKKNSNGKSTKDHKQSDEQQKSGESIEKSSEKHQDVRGKKAMSDIVSASSDRISENSTSDKNTKMPSEGTKKNSTTPTIVAMVPKNRTGSPLVGLRLSKSPPQTPPKPRKRNSGEKSVSKSTENISPLEKCPTDKEELRIKKNCPTNRPKSWAGMEYPDNIDIHTGQFSSSEEMFEPSSQLQQCAVDASFLVYDSEVFGEESPLNYVESSSQTAEEKAEVRPRPGVLKNGRDRSRDSRRSLRVSWGDLPERFDTPSPQGDCDEEKQLEDEDVVDDLDTDETQEAEEASNSTIPRVTQL